MDLLFGTEFCSISADLAPPDHPSFYPHSPSLLGRGTNPNSSGPIPPWRKVRRRMIEIKAKIDSYEVSGTVEHVGRWSTTVRGECGEEISIPNHKLSANVVRNHSRQTHGSIKTKLSIDHLDTPKVKNIVTDMRKVLENDPRVESREVFLDNVNPGNQMIVVSCTLKASYLKEYTSVKEAILLDLWELSQIMGLRSSANNDWSSSVCSLNLSFISKIAPAIRFCHCCYHKPRKENVFVWTNGMHLLSTK